MTCDLGAGAIDVEPRRSDGRKGTSRQEDELDRFGLPPLALALMLASAFVHASWNVLLARVPRGPDTTAVASVLGLIAWTPLALARWHIDRGVWPYLLVTACLQLAYFVTLNLAYARVPAHAAYPLARGLAPVLLLPITALAGGRTPAWAAAAVAAVSAGVLLTTRRAADRRGIAYAAPVAVCIAGYTFVDSRGLHHADPATYLWLSTIPVAAVLVAIRAVVDRGTATMLAEVRLRTLAVGLGVFGSYGLALAALAMVTVAQVPAVAAVRETGVLFIIPLSLLAAVIRPAGRDRMSQTRPTLATALGATLVFGGLAVLALT